MTVFAGVFLATYFLTPGLTRSFFESLSDPLSQRCLQVCQTLMAEAKLDPKSVDVVLLVGGMTRVPRSGTLRPGGQKNSAGRDGLWRLDSSASARWAFPWPAA